MQHCKKIEINSSRYNVSRVHFFTKKLKKSRTKPEKRSANALEQDSRIFTQEALKSFIDEQLCGNCHGGSNKTYLVLECDEEAYLNDGGDEKGNRKSNLMCRTLDDVKDLDFQYIRRDCTLSCELADRGKQQQININNLNPEQINNFQVNFAMENENYHQMLDEFVVNKTQEARGPAAVAKDRYSWIPSHLCEDCLSNLQASFHQRERLSNHVDDEEQISHINHFYNFERLAYPSSRTLSCHFHPPEHRGKPPEEAYQIYATTCSNGPVHCANKCNQYGSLMDIKKNDSSTSFEQPNLFFNADLRHQMSRINRYIRNKEGQGPVYDNAVDGYEQPQQLSDDLNDDVHRSASQASAASWDDNAMFRQSYLQSLQDNDRTTAKPTSDFNDQYSVYNQDEQDADDNDSNDSDGCNYKTLDCSFNDPCPEIMDCGAIYNMKKSQPKEPSSNYYKSRNQATYHADRQETNTLQTHPLPFEKQREVLMPKSRQFTEHHDSQRPKSTRQTERRPSQTSSRSRKTSHEDDDHPAFPPKSTLYHPVTPKSTRYAPSRTTEVSKSNNHSNETKPTALKSIRHYAEQQDGQRNFQSNKYSRYFQQPDNQSLKSKVNSDGVQSQPSAVSRLQTKHETQVVIPKSRGYSEKSKQSRYSTDQRSPSMPSSASYRDPSKATKLPQQSHMSSRYTEKPSEAPNEVLEESSRPTNQKPPASSKKRGIFADCIKCAATGCSFLQSNYPDDNFECNVCQKVPPPEPEPKPKPTIYSKYSKSPSHPEDLPSADYRNYERHQLNTHKKDHFLAKSPTHSDIHLKKDLTHYDKPEPVPAASSSSSEGTDSVADNSAHRQHLNEGVLKHQRKFLFNKPEEHYPSPNAYKSKRPTSASPKHFSRSILVENPNESKTTIFLNNEDLVRLRQILIKELKQHKDKDSHEYVRSMSRINWIENLLRRFNSRDLSSLNDVAATNRKSNDNSAKIIHPTRSELREIEKFKQSFKVKPKSIINLKKFESESDLENEFLIKRNVFVSRKRDTPYEMYYGSSKFANTPPAPYDHNVSFLYKELNNQTQATHSNRKELHPTKVYEVIKLKLLKSKMPHLLKELDKIFYDKLPNDSS